MTAPRPAALRRPGARMTGGEDRLGARLGMLAARFPRFGFRTLRVHDHVAIEAVRNDKDAPGVAVVITGDADELRQVLQEDQDQGSPPGRQAPPGGG